MPQHVAVLHLVRLVEAAGASVPIELETLAVMQAIVTELAVAVAVSLTVKHRTPCMLVAGSACHAAPVVPQVPQLSGWCTSDSQQAAGPGRTQAQSQAPELAVMLHSLQSRRPQTFP